MATADFDLITFDCYGTLIDWEGGIVAAFQQQAARSGLGLDANRIIAEYMREELAVEQQYLPYREVLDETARRVCEHLGLSIPPDRAHFLSESIGRWIPFPDTNAALEQLATRFALGILSNVDDDLLSETRKHFTVGFEPIVTAQQVRSYKPGHAHFLEVRRRAPGKRHLHAAQSYFHDVVPCAELGIPVAWVNRNGETADKGGPLPDYELSNLAGLADLLNA
jgi:2-haloacid dehalogenase/putative hydrolase of the HAD superfamily